jgi:hypothetical protein
MLSFLITKQFREPFYFLSDVPAILRKNKSFQTVDKKAFAKMSICTLAAIFVGPIEVM